MRKRKSILTEQIKWPYNKIDGGLNVVALSWSSTVFWVFAYGQLR